MIIYCGVSHFYVKNSPEVLATKPTILLNQNKVINFCQQWTELIEIEYPHAWYCKLPNHFPITEFGEKFLTYLKTCGLTGTWGAGPSKLVAKLAAHFKPKNIIQDVQKFLAPLPLECLQIPETAQLNRLGIYSVGELANLPLPILTSQFGLGADNLKRMANGQDLEAFAPQQIIDISWEINFITSPKINMLVNRPQLELFLAQGSTALAKQLEKNQLRAKEITLSWETSGETKQAIKAFKPSVNNEKIIFRNLSQVLPNYPVAQLSLIATSVETNVPQQLNILEKNVANQKLATLKAELGTKLTNLTLTRREKVIEMWELSYL